MAKREYIQANKDWLEAKAKEDGVKALPKGIYYKVLSEGNQDSAKPTVRSIITVHYTGRTIDGKQFDSSQCHWMFPYWPAIRTIAWRTDFTHNETGVDDRLLWWLHYVLYIYERESAVGS